MKPYQLRVVEEKDELELKIMKLKSFIDSELFSELGTEDGILLINQLYVMEQYLLILAERILNFD